MPAATSRSVRRWTAGAICGAVLAGFGNIGVAVLVIGGWSLLQESALRESEWAPLGGALLLAYASGLAVVTAVVTLASLLAAWRAVVVRERADVTTRATAVNGPPLSPSAGAGKPIADVVPTKGQVRRARLRARR